MSAEEKTPQASNASESASPNDGAQEAVSQNEPLTSEAPVDAAKPQDESTDAAVASPTPGPAPSEPASSGPLTEDHIREELKKVIDPELFVNIVDLGLIYEVDLKEKEEEIGKFDVSINMTLTSPACPAGPQLVANSKNVVSHLEPVGEVEVKIVLDPPWTPDRMTDDAKDQLGIF